MQGPSMDEPGDQSRDHLPGACRRRRGLTAQLLACFDQWGYSPVAPPALEPFEMLARGLSEDDRRRCVRFVAPPEGRLLALRADVTPQLARMIAQRVGGALPSDGVTRVSYAADVVSHPSGPTERAEVHQVGLELMGDGHVAADIELVTLCDEALRRVGLRDHRVDLAHTGVASAMLDALELDDAERAAVRTMLGHKDRDGLIARLGDGAAAERVASLCDRFGPPSIIDSAMESLPGAADALRRLGAVTAAAPDVPLTVDLGEVRGDDYYSGLRLRAWAPGVARPVIRGGRYDNLLSQYGVPMPAVGFAIDIEALEAALRHAGLDPAPTRSVLKRMVAALPSPDEDATRGRAAAAAAQARVEGMVAWVQPASDPHRAIELAVRAGVDSLALIDGGALRVLTRQSEQWVETPSDQEGK